jgi:hypothetical protein
MNMDTKTLLFLATNGIALVLALTGKLEWAHVKDVLVWTLGPYLIGQSYENAHAPKAPKAEPAPAPAAKAEEKTDEKKEDK